MSLLLYLLFIALFISAYFQIGSQDLWTGVFIVIIGASLYKLVRPTKQNPSQLTHKKPLTQLSLITGYIFTQHCQFLTLLLFSKNHTLLPQIVFFKSQNLTQKQRQRIHYCVQFIPGISTLYKTDTELTLHFFSSSKDKQTIRAFQAAIIEPIKALTP